ncbi:MAG TPA: hypothetical protein VLG67_03605 [Candidatus Saccharimonadales bacterium]|nr:hypothetical protein [Candidatus Saccharimonadales bacterium]
MSPSVDSETYALQSEEIGKSVNYSVVNLDVETETDIRAFDYSVKALLPKQPRYMFGTLQDGEQRLKFIVASSQSSIEGATPQTRIYLFDGTTIDHAQFFHELRKKHGDQTLHSAGFLELAFDNSLDIRKRNLAGYSESLEKQFGLDKEISDSYRRGPLLQKLGNRFTALDKQLATSLPAAQ